MCQVSVRSHSDRVVPHGERGRISKPDVTCAAPRHQPAPFLSATARPAKTTLAGSLLGAPTLLSRRSQAAPRTREQLFSPSGIRSVQSGEFAISGLLYNGAYLPPLFRPKLGGTMRIAFRNQLPVDASNLHYYGLSVSPQGNSDNVCIHVHPGQAVNEVRIPADDRQGPGFFWYHPHVQGWSPSTHGWSCRRPRRRWHGASLSHTEWLAGRLSAHQASRGRRDHLDQRSDPSRGGSPAERNAVLAHRPISAPRCLSSPASKVSRSTFLPPMDIFCRSGAS